MTVTVPSTVLVFQPILKNSYDQKPGSWHLSFKASIAGTVRSCCGCIMFCDILTSKHFLIEVEELKADKILCEHYVCHKCLEALLSKMDNRRLNR
jgi:hypothetical protein